MLRILYVEDDAVLQADGGAMLEEAGFEVALAATGPDACVLLDRRHHQIDALITDINLDGPMSGWRVAEIARALNPELAVLYVSASERCDFATCGVSDSRWVSKPFAWSEITEAIAAMAPR